MALAHGEVREPELLTIPLEALRDVLDALYACTTTSFAYRLDHAYESFGPADGLTLPRRPSEYMTDQLWATFTFEDMWKEALPHFNPDRVMWGSDFPHPGSTWPDSEQFVTEHFGDAPADVLERMLGSNAAALYGL